MPYVEKHRREDLTPWEVKRENPGELNYSITVLCVDYLKTNGESYHVYNDIIGALECAKLEMYRRKVADYENAKMIKNGDVY